MQYDDLIGIPFKDGGRDKTGLDCWGLAKEIYKRRGIELPEFNISAMATDRITNALTENKPLWRKLNKPEPSALVVIKLVCGGWADHVGVCIDNNKFIHAYCRTGVVIDRLSKWQSHIAGFYVPGWL
ncbi:C40 family peptidase [Pectinatus frisingensis]|uniref:C40 family peptidase n=1 Tax=Pectinatus frisingensis TaxID=865 RepID=UPI0018C57504|nr:NlpC/P60 family protein [Pectinatus frisingensis]